VDEEFWASQLISDETIRKIGEGTRVIRHSENDGLGGDGQTKRKPHGATGQGPFGQLTRLGLLQMIQVGTSLRERLVGTTSNSGVLWTPTRPIHPSHLAVYSTDFPRTIQSVQGLLVGLFPDGFPERGKGEGDSDSDVDNSDSVVVDIDTRHTDAMIPDPQPRRTAEQAVLERELARSDRVVRREAEMIPLARRVTELVRPMLSPTAHEISFGVDGSGDGSNDNGGGAGGETSEPEEIEVQPLSWNQLAEVCKCLSVYDRLPPELADRPEDVDCVISYAAERWFANLDPWHHPRLLYLATNDLVRMQIDAFCREYDDDPEKTVSEGDPKTIPTKQKLLTIWSAHDSTLVGLLCAYRLRRQPALPSSSSPIKPEWPDYASHLLLELLLHVPTGEQYVRFSLNGQDLACHWERDEERPRQLIPLRLLAMYVEESSAGRPSVAVHTSASQ
jgi:acid phosphatase